MKVLVVGGAGFIGKSVCFELRLRGHEVYVLDDMSSGTYDNVRQGLGDQNHEKFVFGCATNQELMYRVIEHVDCVVHLAALVSVEVSQRNPLASEKNTYLSTIIVGNACKMFKKRMVFASSASVYGTKEGVVSESELLVPCSVYGMDKKKSEDYLQLIAEESFGINTLRFFNVYGKNQNPMYGAVIPAFVKAFENELVALRS